MKGYLIRFKGTLIVFFIFLILLASVFLFNKEKPADVETEKVFPNIIPEEITSIKLKDESSQFSLEKADAGSWVVVTDSGTYRADKELADKLVNAVTEMEIQSSIQGGSDKLNEYGFVDSTTEFSVTTEKADYPVIIGDKSPVGPGVYIYDLGEGRIMIVDYSYLEGFINKNAQDYRDRKLFTLGKDKVDRITLRVGDFSVELKKVNGKWVLKDSPVPETPDQGLIAGLLESYSELEVSDFVDNHPADLSDFGLTEPVAEIGFYSGEDGELFLYGRRRDESDFYVKVASQEPVYSISKDYFKVLPKNIDKLKAK